MTLTEDQARQIVKDNPNGPAIKIKREKAKVLKANVTGIGDDILIKAIDGFERKAYGESRKKMRISNKDIIHRVMYPRNKIYTAKGGIEQYIMGNQKQVDEYRLFLSQCRGTQSLKDYIRQNIQPMYDYDPEGLLWLDLNSYGNPYPCFKSIQVIYDYELNGRQPEYVVFQLSTKEIKQLDLRAKGANVSTLTGKLIKPPGEQQPHKIFRCVCDGYDRIISYENTGEPLIISEIANPFAFMGVPGRIVSDIVGACNTDEDACYDSPLNPAIEVLSQAMFGRSLYNISFARCAYPKEWMTKMPCPTCKATGLVDGVKCPECKGTKAMPAQLHSDVLIIDYQADANKSMPTPPMGQVDPAVEALRFMQENNMTWEETFNHTIWGATSTQTNNLTHKPTTRGNVESTAYEAQLNEQPKHDRLTDFSMWGSDVYKWYADGCGKYIYSQSYIDSGIMFGQRFMIESADATFDRLLKARTGGATKSELDSLTLEYIENKYPTDPVNYRKYYILFIAEPFYHDTIADVLTWDVPVINKMEKMFFDEWSATLTDDYFAMVKDDGLEEKVKSDLRAYVMGRMKKDNDADTLLFTAMGQLVNIGDSVTVKKDKAMSPAHLGATYKVSNISGRYATITSGEGDSSVQVNGYNVTDLIKQ